MGVNSNIGEKFGKLTVLSVSEGVRYSGSKKFIAECACECGNIIQVEKYNLRTGNTTQCNECAVISRGKNRRTHGNSVARKDADPDGYNCYTRWQSMKRRCYKEYDSHYPRYGGRGIKVCDRWLNSYENFLTDMGLPPFRDHQIDRIDNDGDYSPENCRWVTRTENSRNKSNNKLLTAYGETLTQSQWAERLGIKRETIAKRMDGGYSHEEALSVGEGRITRKSYTTSEGSFSTIQAAANHYGISISGAHGRFKSDSFPDWVST